MTTSNICRIALVVFSLLSTLAQAQVADWDANPKLHSEKEKYLNESAVILTDRRLHDYVDDGKGGIVVNVTNHKLIKVNNDKGVEMYNKIYIPVSYDAVIQEIKARVITPSGKVIDLPADKILDAEEEGRPYKKFALEGVEKGSEVEYLFRQQKALYFFGLEVYQGSSTPCQQAEFMLSVPAHLSFTTKGYNGFKVRPDTVIDNKRIIYASCEDIPVLENEKYGETAPYVANVQYKLSYNLDKDKNVRLFTWNQLAKNVFDSYNNIDEKEQKAVASFVKSIKLPEGGTEEAKIVALEDYLKNNIGVNEEGIGEDADKIEKIVKTRVASTDGLTKLFAACFKDLGIGYQIVFPSKRNELPLDEKLENYRLIDDVLFYFPGTGQFMEPANISFRYPFIQPFWAATRGLFLKTVSVGGLTSAYAAFDTIPMQSYEKSTHNIEASLRFNATLDSVLLHSRQIFTGYGASFYRPAFHFLPKDRIGDFTKEIIQSVSKSKNISNVEVHNSAMTDGAANKPLIIEGDIVSADLLEQAGKKILLKLGDVIGPQEEMYQEKQRLLPITIQYPHILDRTIELLIPEGYTIKNPEDINISITGKETGNDNMGFVSSYKMEGNKLLVNIHEYYKDTDYEMSRLENFKNVINAAADFNKVVLVLEKK